MNRLLRVHIVLGVLVISLSFSGVTIPAGAAASRQGAVPNTPIEHFIVIMQENHTFDNYFGTYPGADGILAGTCMPVNPFEQAATNCVEPFHIGDGPIEVTREALKPNLTFNSGYTLRGNGGRSSGVRALLRNGRGRDRSAGADADRVHGFVRGRHLPGVHRVGRLAVQCAGEGTGWRRRPPAFRWIPGEFPAVRDAV